MAHYVKKPVAVEATQFWISHGLAMGSPIPVRYMDDAWKLFVEKSDAWCVLEEGDYIVSEPDGVGYYPCKRTIFEASHELA